jgi:hypothetical protein
VPFASPDLSHEWRGISFPLSSPSTGEDKGEGDPLTLTLSRKGRENPSPSTGEDKGEGEIPLTLTLSRKGREDPFPSTGED